MNKQPYSKPTLFKVELNYHQSVLAACSSLGVNMKRGAGFCNYAGNQCRGSARIRNADSGTGS